MREAENDTMTMQPQPIASPTPKWVVMLALAMSLGGAAIFVINAAIGTAAEKAWEAYLINFLLFSAIAHGAVLFSALMNTVNARWSGPRVPF